MEEEVNQKVVSLTVRTGKLTASVLARAMRDFLDGQKSKPHKYAKGKQSFKQLMEQNAGAMNIEVDKSDIRGFERYARKYHVVRLNQQAILYSLPDTRCLHIVLLHSPAWT